ncbi:MAG: cytokinin riboside 5'-monophosphate phosphoribohydrolase [Planctomycetota bacterium]
MPHVIRNVCVFCGSSPGRGEPYAEAARALGRRLVEENLGLVYGGGSVGLMGIVADTVLSLGGRAIGVIPHSLKVREVGHAGLTEQHVVDTMHERKTAMADRADAFIAMPGGYGTFEEFLEIVTWLQLGIHAKPCGLLNVRGYYDKLLDFLDHAVGEGFLRPENRRLIVTAETPDALLAALRSTQIPPIEPWITRAER